MPSTAASPNAGDKRYGIVGDGGADDTDAWLAFIDDVKSLTGWTTTVNGVTTHVGCTGLVPAGAKIKIDHSRFALPDVVGFTLMGGGSRGHCNYMDGASTLLIDGTGSDASSYGIALEGAALETCRNVKLLNLGVHYTNGFAGDLIRGITNGVRGFVSQFGSYGSDTVSGARPLHGSEPLAHEGWPPLPLDRRHPSPTRLTS
jgi:hypothetical protein